MPGVTAPRPPNGAPLMPIRTLNCGAGLIALCINGVVGLLNMGVAAPPRAAEPIEYIIGDAKRWREPCRAPAAAVAACAAGATGAVLEVEEDVTG